ncbi:MAG: molecular chaperone HtpG, partial [Candidatus Hydrogenedentes bacterium]|nr:molecular chaperone HtpG [Candidatus Hydrogenedentota bacterium]
LTEPVDEVWTSTVQEFKGKQLKSAGRGAVDLGTEEERKAKAEKNKEQEEAHSNLFECLKEKLATHIKEVRLSARLTSSPACLVTDEGDISPQLEQLLRASDQPVPETKRILEVNAEHPLLDKLQDLYNGDAKDPALDDYAELLYGQAVIAEGGQPPNPGKFSKLVADLMVKTL